MGAVLSTETAFMHAAETFHVPDGATALVAVIGSDKTHSRGYLFALVPVGHGAVIMLVIEPLVNNIIKTRRYSEFRI